jgi:hypothetical protein
VIAEAVAIFALVAVPEAPVALAALAALAAAAAAAVRRRSRLRPPFLFDIDARKSLRLGQKRR